MEGFILVGGKSSRMGTDKAGLMIGGRSMLDRATDALAAVAVDGISVVGGHAKGSENVRVIADPEFVAESDDRAGPMLGVYAALYQARSDWIAILACDLPFVSGDLLQTLAAIERTGIDAVVPLQRDGIAQPLCALYRCDPCLSVIDRLIDSGDRSMRSLLASIKTRFVAFDELKTLENSEHLFLNVNSPVDHARAISIAGA